MMSEGLKSIGSCMHGDCSSDDFYPRPCEYPACIKSSPHAACDARIKELEAERDEWERCANRWSEQLDAYENVEAVFCDHSGWRAAESRLHRATEALKQMLDEDELDYAPHCLAIARTCLAEIRGEQ